jgi:hypothetical protein
MRNKWKNVGAGALVVGAAISTSAFARADCSKDTDCKGDRVCNAGVCVEGAPSTAPAAPPPVATAPAVIVMPAAPQSQMASRKTRNAGIGLFIAGLVMDAAGTALYVGGKTSSCKQETPFANGDRHRALGGRWRAGARPRADSDGEASHPALRGSWPFRR